MLKFRYFKNIKNAQKLAKWQFELKNLIIEREQDHKRTLEQNALLQERLTTLDRKIDEQDLVVEEARHDERKKAGILKVEIKKLKDVIAQKDMIIQRHMEGIYEKRLVKELRERVDSLDRENIDLVKKYQQSMDMKDRALTQVDNYKKKLDEMTQLFQGEKKLDIPAKDLVEMKLQEVSLADRFYKKSDIDKQKQELLTVAGDFREYEVKDLKARKLKVIMNKPVNETPEHFALQNLVFRLVKEYTETAQMFIAVKPDIVFHTSDGLKIALEIETGTQLKSGVQKFVDEKVKILKRDYSDYYFIVTRIDDRSKYENYGKVLARHEVEKKLREFFPLIKPPHGYPLPLGVDGSEVTP